MEQVKILSDHPNVVKHLTYSPDGKYLAASCVDGTIYVYINEDDHVLLSKTVEGIIRPLKGEDHETSECVWHPDSRTFACPSKTKDIATVSVADGVRQRSFKSGHVGDILCVRWSPNGALLASTSNDSMLVLWETKTQRAIRKFEYDKIMNVTFHPLSQNSFDFTTETGMACRCQNFFKDDLLRLLQGPAVRSPYYHDPLDTSSNTISGRKSFVSGLTKDRAARAGSPDSLDRLLAEDADADWIDDDDEGGYTNANGKRTNARLHRNGWSSKRSRQEIWSPQIHEPFQPGATPWRGNRKYLSMSLIGYVWTVDQDTHNTVTVEFYDRQLHRSFHFTDPYLYDKACLSEHGLLFSCPISKDNPSIIFYRPHETWTDRVDWRTPLPEGEEAVAIALSNTLVTVLTSAGYVRVYTLYGTPMRIWRQKSGPAVACAAMDDHVLTICNGPVGPDGCTQLIYSIEDVRREKVFQSGDILALPPEGILTSVFFSDDGDPCIYDSSGTLLVLFRWRIPGQAKWVPLLDTTRLERLASGRKQETYWPVAMAQNKFHCVILKGGDTHPYFPKPILSEFDLCVPVSIHSKEEAERVKNGDATEAQVRKLTASKLEEAFVRLTLLMSLMTDRPNAKHTSEEQTKLTLEINKTLLQLLAAECIEGEERGMKAVDIVELLNDDTGKILESAAKVASRWGRSGLEEKIREVAEKRLLEADEAMNAEDD